MLGAMHAPVGLLSLLNGSLCLNVLHVIRATTARCHCSWDTLYPLKSLPSVLSRGSMC